MKRVSLRDDKIGVDGRLGRYLIMKCGEGLRKCGEGFVKMWRRFCENVEMSMRKLRIKDVNSKWKSKKRWKIFRFLIKNVYLRSRE